MLDPFEFILEVPETLPSSSPICLLVSVRRCPMISGVPRIVDDPTYGVCAGGGEKQVSAEYGVGGSWWFAPSLDNTSTVPGGRSPLHHILYISFLFHSPHWQFTSDSRPATTERKAKGTPLVSGKVTFCSSRPHWQLPSDLAVNWQ